MLRGQHLGDQKLSFGFRRPLVVRADPLFRRLKRGRRFLQHRVTPQRLALLLRRRTDVGINGFIKLEGGILAAGGFQKTRGSKLGVHIDKRMLEEFKLFQSKRGGLLLIADPRKHPDDPLQGVK